jgi:hypothetical protein
LRKWPCFQAFFAPNSTSNPQEKPMIPDHAALIPRGSPLAVGWRADLVAILLSRNLVDVMDTIAQFAELRVRAEPDTARDPLDAAEESVVERRRLFTDPQGKPYYGPPRPNKGDVPLTTARAADPAHRRIDAVVENLIALHQGRDAAPAKLRGHNSKLRTIRPIDRGYIPGRRRQEV